MKKRLFVAAFAVMALGLVGCGDKKEEATTAATTEEITTTEATTEDVTEEETEEATEEVVEETAYAGFYTATIPEGYVINDNNDKIQMDGNSSFNIAVRTYKSEVEKEKETWIGYGKVDKGTMTFNGIEWTVVSDEDGRGVFLWVASGDGIVEVQISSLTLEDEAVQTILNSLTITTENTVEANQAFFAK